jgi:hypothetical protein
MSLEGGTQSLWFVGKRDVELRQSIPLSPKEGEVTIGFRLKENLILTRDSDIGC